MGESENPAKAQKGPRALGGPVLPGTTVQVPVLSGVRHLEVSNGGRGAVDVVVNERQDLLIVAVREDGSKDAGEEPARTQEAFSSVVTTLQPFSRKAKRRILRAVAIMLDAEAVMLDE